MDEAMYRACKGPGEATFRHPGGQFAKSAVKNESSNSPNSYVMAAPDWLSPNYTAES